MSISLSAIQAPIARELIAFDAYFKSAMRSDVALLDRVTQYILKTKGKQMRPMLVLFSAQISGGISPTTYRSAALVELLHTATLVHDDVVDDSDERRGFFSINALWKNKISVLVGDFLLSRGLLLSLDNGDFQALKIVSKAVKSMSEGELLQMQKARTLNLDEAVYFDIIRQKTASLFAACCEAGAGSATEDEHLREQMRLFGEKLGIAFQIKDDLFDFGSDDVGKPRAQDLREHKMTLPIIYVLNRAPRAERNRLVSLIKSDKATPEEIKYVVSYVHTQGGIAYATEKMNALVAEAKAFLAAFPESSAKTSLLQLVDYTIDRKK